MKNPFLENNATNRTIVFENKQQQSTNKLEIKSFKNSIRKQIGQSQEWS